MCVGLPGGSLQCPRLIPGHRPYVLEAWVIREASFPAWAWDVGSGILPATRTLEASRWVVAACCRAPGHAEGCLLGDDTVAPGQGVAAGGSGSYVAAASLGVQDAREQGVSGPLRGALGDTRGTLRLVRGEGQDVAGGGGPDGSAVPSPGRPPDANATFSWAPRGLCQRLLDLCGLAARHRGLSFPAFLPLPGTALWHPRAHVPVTTACRLLQSPLCG